MPHEVAGEASACLPASAGLPSKARRGGGRLKLMKASEPPLHRTACFELGVARMRLSGLAWAFLLLPTLLSM
jgi:hypothetical protein